MLKVAYTGADIFQNTKCGEIYCIGAAVFDVNCCLCGSKLQLDQFPSHFQREHFTLIEQSIDRDAMEDKKNITFTEPTIIDLSETAIDPINEVLESINNTEPSIMQRKTSHSSEDEDEISLKKLIKKKLKQRSQVKKETTEEICLPSKKHLNRKAKKSQKIAEEITAVKPIPPTKCIEAIEQLPSESKTSNNANTESKETDGYEHLDNDKDNWWIDEETEAESDVIDSNETQKEVLPFHCTICNRFYRTKNSLKTHKSTAHNSKNIGKKRSVLKTEHKCDECNEFFSSARLLNGHKWKHTGIFCDICGRTFTQAGNMIRHKIRHTGQKDFKCKECPKDFYSAKELRMHMLSHSKVMPVVCEICGKGCRDRGVLTAHMRRHTGERPAKCEVCGKRFFSIHDLNIHAVTHSSERPFKCDICGSTFQRKKSLRIHKLTHSQNRKHVCKICGKGFAQSSGLNSHLRSHDAAIGKSAGCMETVAVV